MSSSVCGDFEKSSLSRGLSEAVEQLVQLIVRDCVIVWIRDITSDHARIKELLMFVKFVAVYRLHNYKLVMQWRYWRGNRLAIHR